MAIASVVLVMLIVFFAAPSDQRALWWWIGRAWIVVGLWYLFGPLWESGRGSAALKTKPGSDLVTGVADDTELLGDLDGRGAAVGVAGVHRSLDGEDLAHLRR